MKYEVLVSGHVLATVDTKEKAEKKLEEAKNSYLRIVHPIDTFRIRVAE